MNGCRAMSASARAPGAEKAERQAEAFPAKKKDPDEGDSSQQELPLHRVASEVNGKPKPSAQHNFTDPDSCIMVKDGAYIQAYNAQTHRG